MSFSDPYDDIEKNEKEIASLKQKLEHLEKVTNNLKKQKETEITEIQNNFDLLESYNTGTYGGRDQKNDPNYLRKEKQNYILRCVDFFFFYSNFKLIKQEFNCGYLDIKSHTEILKETREFLAYIKKMLIQAHELHNKNLCTDQNALVIRPKKNKPCTFCKDVLYGPSSGDPEIKKGEKGRRCICKAIQCKEDDDWVFFASGCRRKLILCSKKDIDVLDSMSLDSTKPRTQFEVLGQLKNKRNDNDPNEDSEDSEDSEDIEDSDDDDGVICCGKQCGHLCDIRNFPGFGETWS